MNHVWLVDQKAKLRVWSEANQNWIEVDGWQNLQDITYAKSNHKEVCLYLPTHLTLVLENELSAGQLKQLGEAGKQYLFEELSLTPVELLQVRNLIQAQKNTFYALNNTLIEQWQQSAQLAGFKISALLPDFLLLPSPDITRYGQKESKEDIHKDSQIAVHDTPVYIFEDKIQHTFLVRYSAVKGIAVNHFSLLPRVLADAKNLHYISSDDIIDNALNPNLNSGYSDGPQATPNTDIPDSMTQIADKIGANVISERALLKPVANPSKHPLNFIKVKRNFQATPYLTLAASILLLAGIIQIAGDALQWYQYEQSIEKTNAATEAQFKAWFPEERLNPRVNVSTQVEPRLLQSQNDSQQQLFVLNRISPLLKQSNVVAQSIAWDESAITMVVKGNSREEIDQIQRTLNDQGIVANLGAINPVSDGGVIGELTLAIDSETSASNQTAANG